MNVKKQTRIKFPLLKEVVEHIYIVAYKEDVTKLQNALSKEGFKSTVIRYTYTEEEKKYSPIIRGLLTHSIAWKCCAKNSGLTIVVEADFVPVKGFSCLPVPFDINRKDESWGWLYTCGPALYDLYRDGFARGHSAAPVATLLGPTIAKVLLDFASEYLKKKNPYQYSPWDTQVRIYAQKRGIMSFLPFRNYGEHGGIPDPDHKLAGLTATHRADVLYGKLHFLPPYAKGSKIKFLKTRMWAKSRGFGRLVLGRYIERPTLIRTKGFHNKYRLLLYSLNRLLSFY